MRIKKSPYNIALASLLLIPLFILTACSASDQSPEQPAGLDSDVSLADTSPRMTVLAHGTSSNITQPKQLIITNKQDWDSMWLIHTEGRQVRRPKVNFENEMAIAVFAGQQPSGGYTVRIEKLKMQDEVLEIYVSFHEPGPSDMVTLALTQPYYIVSTPKHTGKVHFKYLPRKEKEIDEY